MTREELQQKMSELLGMATPENQARASELITDISDSFATLSTENNGRAEEITRLTNNNEELRRVNTKLLLKTGVIPNDPPSESNTPPSDSEEPKITFDSLFNDKGVLI